VGTIREVLRRIGRALRWSAAVPTEPCPVCGEPIPVLRATPKMIRLEPHPVELIEACQRRNGTTHTRAELAAGLERRRREGPRTSAQQLADLEERLRRG
jgi:hypothetical protein